MIPMLRTRARPAAVSMDTETSSLAVECRGVGCRGLRGRGRSGWFGGPSMQAGGLPAVVGEGLVGLGHLVHVLAPLDARAEPVGGVEELVHEPLGHGLLAALAGEAGQP